MSSFCVILCTSTCRHFAFFRLHLTTVRKGTYWKHKLNSNRKRAPSLPRMLPLLRFCFHRSHLSQRQKIFERNIHYINRKYTFMASHVVTSSSSACIHFCESTFLVNRFCLNPLNPNYPESLLPESPESEF
jgi:hypothetical protein